ncbi:MAG: FHA domain-containing protein [Anaerolineae bacterium]|nr:FHA domain-containing protein [Anaerolineae bacterium]
MSNDVVLLILRLAASAALLGFVGAIGWMLWQDFQQSTKVAVKQSAFSRGRLVVTKSDVEGVQPGQSWVLQRVTKLGRATTNTIVIAEPFASNEHALVAWRGGQWWLEDLKSSNGTLLNGVRIHEPTVLSAGDVIGFGRVLMRLEIE